MLTVIDNNIHITGVGIVIICCYVEMVLDIHMPTLLLFIQSL